MDLKETVKSKGPILPRLGAAFVILPGAMKFIDYAGWVADFEELGIPLASVMVLVVGVVQVTGGFSVLVGLAGRIGALGLAGVMVGVFLTEGVFLNGGLNYPAVLVFVSSVLVIVAGTGEYSVADERELYETVRGYV